MGTHLSLSLKNRTEKNITAANTLWDSENPGYEGTFHLRTRADVKADIEYIKTDPEQAHLRYLKTVKDWNNAFKLWGSGQFQVKISMGDYLCSEMARRYLAFLEQHGNLFVTLPSEYEMSIINETAASGDIAEDCLVNCPKCKAAKPKAE